MNLSVYDDAILHTIIKFNFLLLEVELPTHVLKKGY